MKNTLFSCAKAWPVFLLVLISLLLSTNSVLSQSLLTQTVKGTIIDQQSEQAIIGANIVLLNTDPFIGAATDLDGAFRLADVPIGRHSFKISCIGYEDAFISELEIGTGKEVILTVRLVESLVLMDEVVVKANRLAGTAENEMAVVSARSFTVEQTKKYAAGFSDPARMALSFAGVSNSDDGDNQIVVRGNSPKGILWRMEGVEIPNPNHFSSNGASGGGISALSVNVLANSDFFTGAFPAEYGNASSGVFDLKLRNGNNETREYAFQAGVLGLDFSAEGPIGKPKGASYLANYRYSTLALLDKAGLFPSGGSVITFQDAAFKVHVPTAGGNYISLWGLGGLSKDTYEEEGDTERYDFKSDRGVLGLNYRHFVNKNAYVETILSYAYEFQGEDYEDTAYQEVFKDGFTTKSFKANILYNQKLNARHTLRMGVNTQQIDFQLLETYQDSVVNEVNVDEKGATQLFQAYAQWKYRIQTNLQFTAGLHATTLRLGGQSAIEPRLGLRWNFMPGKVLSFGAGLHNRIEPLPVYFAKVPDGDETTQPNKELALNKAAHFVLGYEWRFAEGWRFQSELYYQHLYDVPIGTANVDPDSYLYTQSWLNAESGFVADSLVSEGTGRNYGMEITLEKFFSDGWYILSTTSLYRALYTPRDGIERASRFDGRFVQNILGGKEWTVGKNSTNTISVNLKLVYTGGQRYTPIDLEKSIEEGSTERIWSKAYENKVPNYFRADFGFSYRKNRKKTTSVISLNIQNVSNRQNVGGYYFDSDDAEIKSFTQLGLLPIINYRLEF